MGDSISGRDVSHLVDRIYDCALDPALWDEVLSDIRTLLSSADAVLVVIDRYRHKVLLHRTTGIAAARFGRSGAHLAEIAGFAEAQLDEGLSMDEPLVASRLTTADQRDRSRYWQAAGRAGIVDAAALLLARTPTRLSLLAMARREAQGRFADRDMATMRLLLPHVRRAVAISTVLDAMSLEKSRLGETLDALDLGVILAGEDGEILHSNRCAAVMMAGAGPLRAAAGTLQAEGRAGRAIRAAVKTVTRGAASGASGIAVRLAADDAPPLFAHVLPLAGGEPGPGQQQAATAAVFVSPRRSEARAAAAAATAFGLTAAETRVLKSVLAGRSVTEAAGDLGVAVSTVRSQLNTVFAKTRTTRQSELVRLALSLLPIAIT